MVPREELFKHLQQAAVEWAENNGHRAEEAYDGLHLQLQQDDGVVKIFQVHIHVDFLGARVR